MEPASNCRCPAFAPGIAPCSHVPRVRVPKIKWEASSRRVLTMEWIDGVKLTDEKGEPLWACAARPLQTSRWSCPPARLPRGVRRHPGQRSMSLQR